ncbi:MAG: hypothetical protein U5O39_03535 [Gammaproteobacteria bacterium]|nr:hypothetical protein [Gammaproteobacteria bacterium]
MLIDFEARSTKLLMAADPDAFLFDWCRFVNDERVICRIRSYGELKAGNTGFFRRYHESRTTFYRLIAVDIDGSDVLQLVELAEAGPRDDLEWNPADQSRIVSWLPQDNNHILIQLARDDRVYPSVYRLNIRNNRMLRVQRHRGGVLNWYADDEGELYMASGYLGRDEPAAWSLVDGFERLDLSADGGLEPPALEGLAADGSSVWVVGNDGNDTRGIGLADLANRRGRKKLCFAIRSTTRSNLRFILEPGHHYT